ncbi:MAG: acyltransferase [Clostridiales bacterium]|nr:acyltransferase [Clostridiales bacterium]
MNTEIETIGKVEEIKEYSSIRVILTLLVVLGHCTYYKIITSYGGVDYSSYTSNCCRLFRYLQLFSSFISLFHMPLFMALSGALFFKTISKGKYGCLRDLLIDKGKRLIVPYLFVSIFYSFPIKYLSGYYIESKNLIKDLIIGQILLQGNSHLWYCVTLFLITLYVYLVIKRFNIPSFMQVFIALALNIYSHTVGVNFIAYFCEYLVWFYIGYHFETVRKTINKTIENINIIGCLLFLTLFFFLLFLYYYFDKVRIFYLLAYIIKDFWIILLMLMVYAICYLISKSQVVQSKAFLKLRRNSFGIYLYSDPLNYLILNHSILFGGADLYKSPVAVVLLYFLRFILTLISASLITDMLRKFNCKYLY